MSHVPRKATLAPTPTREARGEGARANMSAKSLGTRREYMERDFWREQGWYAIRTHDDDSACDVIAARPDGGMAHLMLIEVKANRAGGAFHNFRPEDRRRLLEAAELAGAEAYLSWWPPHGGGLASRRFIPARDWPKEKEVLP